MRIPLVTVAMLWALLSCPKPALSATHDLVLHDPRRNRDVPLKIYAPSQMGMHPLIIVSPGFGGDRDGYVYLARAWSAAGYFVIVMTHLGSDRPAVLRYGAALALDPHASYGLQVERTTDVAYVLNGLDTLEREVLLSDGRIDRARIGVAGHSMGAGTALLLAGARGASPGDAPRSFRDARIRAAVAMSPQGPGAEGFSDGSWNSVQVPVMTMSGTLDVGIAGEPPQWRLEPFQQMPPTNKFQVTVQGARHLSFATGEAFHPCIVRETTTFWNAFLSSTTDPSQIVTVGACTVSSK